MKSRTASFLVALCLANTLAFADSPTDAPLAMTSPYADSQQAKGAGSAQQPRNQHKRANCRSQQTARIDSKSDQPKTPSKSEAKLELRTRRVCEF
jgi:hypothetical protein